MFSRCAKALIEAADGGAAGNDRAIGLTLELVAEKDPYALGPGGELPVVLLLEGKPLAGALVQAIAPRGPEVKAGRAHGPPRARHAPPARKPGFWLIKAVEMTPAPGRRRCRLEEPLGLVNL